MAFVDAGNIHSSSIGDDHSYFRDAGAAPHGIKTVDTIYDIDTGLNTNNLQYLNEEETVAMYNGELYFIKGNAEANRYKESTKDRLSTLESQLYNKDVMINYMQDLINTLTDKVNRTVGYVHNCRDCGAKLEIDIDKGIFHCKYCGATYIVGAVQPNVTYRY